MKSDAVKAFGSIINPKYKIDNNCLEEKDSTGKVIMSHIVKLRNVDDILLWRFDPNIGDVFPFFSDKVKGLKAISDYFMLVERGGRHYLCIIELKLSSTSAKKQLEASRMFAEYLIASAKRLQLVLETPAVVKVRVVGGKPLTNYRQPEYEHDSGYISYRFPGFFDIKKVLDVYDQVG